MTVEHRWNRHILSTSPLYDPLHVFDAALREHHCWPKLDDYQQLLQYAHTTVLSGGNKPITFVPQGEKPQSFKHRYEPRIYLQGEVQTRTRHWHDFFQVLVWSLFSKTKQRLNKQHYLAAKQRQQSQPNQKNRSPLENALTLFDECGAIIVSSSKTVLDLIRSHQWKTLFWERRDKLQQELQCLTFGHALYEKTVAPYIGMTAQALLLLIPNELFLLRPFKQRLITIDELVAKQFGMNGTITTPKQLHPFPILGMPGWHPDNNKASFYDNTHYFR